MTQRLLLNQHCVKLLSRSSRQRERLNAMGLFICLFVCWCVRLGGPIWIKSRRLVQNTCRLWWYDRNRNRKYNSDMADICSSKPEIVISQLRIELQLRNSVCW